MSYSDEENESGYKINDRRIANKEPTSEDKNISRGSENSIHRQSGKQLIFSFNGRSFYGEIWERSGRVLKATDYYWSETSLYGETSVTGGAGHIDTDFSGRVHGRIDPVNVSVSISSSSSKRHQVDIWYELDGNPCEEFKFEGFPVPAREGHSIRLVYGMIEGCSPFFIKCINRSTGLESSITSNAMKDKVFFLSCSIIEQLHAQQPKQTRSILGKIFKSAPKKDMSIPNPSVFVDGILTGFDRLVKEKY